MTGVVVLNPEKGYIFRITHVANVAGILAHGGLHFPNTSQPDPGYVNIGNPDLIDKRARRTVPIEPGGTLSDYVPFYFTPYSIMLYNILTGHSVARRANEDIVILVSSISRLRELALPFLTTNQHAYPVDTDFYEGTSDLTHIDWPLLQQRDFRRDTDDPGKQARYQAEALVHSHVPLNALRGIVCYNDTVRHSLEALMVAHDTAMPVRALPEWYFSL